MVGVGSTLFHLTLRYKNLFWIKLCKFTCRHSMQVLDEVPMIWGSCFMVYTMQGVRRMISYDIDICILISGLFYYFRLLSSSSPYHSSSSSDFCRLPLNNPRIFQSSTFPLSFCLYLSFPTLWWFLTTSSSLIEDKKLTFSVSESGEKGRVILPQISNFPFHNTSSFLPHLSVFH